MSSDIKTKHCNLCNQELPLDEFHGQKTKAMYCKSCRSSYNKSMRVYKGRSQFDRLTDEQKKQLVDMIMNHVPQTKIADTFGLKPSTIALWNRKNGKIPTYTQQLISAS